MCRKGDAEAVHGFYAFIIAILVLNGVEFVVSIVGMCFVISPKRTESRVRRFLRCCLCCIIHDDEVIDALVNGIMELPSFQEFAFTDVILGLIMTNIVFHDKKKTITTIADPDERLRVRKMRVNEYVEYLHRIAKPHHLSTRSGKPPPFLHQSQHARERGSQGVHAIHSLSLPPALRLPHTRVASEPCSRDGRARRRMRGNLVDFHG